MRRAVYVILIFLIGMITSDPQPPSDVLGYGEYAEARVRGHVVGQVIGGGVGAVLGTFGLAALILGWRTSTRRFIPGTACFFAFLLVVGQEPPSAESDGPDPEAAMESAGADLEAHIQARAHDRGIQLGMIPTGWLTPAYLADAGKYPHVPTYFTRSRDLLQELDTTSATVYITSVRARLLESGLPPSRVEAMVAELRAEMEREAPEIRRRSDNELALMSAALELHTFLERVDSRVHLDPADGKASFTREAEHTRAIQLANEVTRLSALVKAQNSGARPPGTP